MSQRTLRNCDICQKDISNWSDSYRLTLDGLSMEIKKDLCRDCCNAILKGLNAHKR